MNNDRITTFLVCPVCNKGKVFSFGASGKMSSHCAKCGRTIMWDFDELKAYPIINFSLYPQKQGPKMPLNSH